MNRDHGHSSWIPRSLVPHGRLRPWPRTLAFNCAAWCALECCFEVGQLESLGSRIAAALPEWTGRVPVSDVARNYFISGTFDLRDIVACLLAAFIAYLVVRKIYQGAEP